MNLSESQLNEKINEILLNGTSLDDLIDGSNNCLHISVLNSFRKCTDKLLSAGANPFLPNAFDKSAFDLALEGGQQAIFLSLSRRSLFSKYPLLPTNTVFFIVPVGNNAIYEDYLDWSHVDRLQRNQELLQALKQEELFCYAKLGGLSEQRHLAVVTLKALQIEIQSSLEVFAMQIHNIIQSEAEERKTLNEIVEDLAKVKECFEHVYETTYWWGDVTVHRSNIIVDKWETAKLCITGVKLSFDFDSTLDDNLSQHSTSCLSEISSEPYISLKSGPVRRQIRKSRDALRHRLAKQRNFQVDLNLLTRLEILKVGDQDHLTKTISLFYSYPNHSTQNTIRLQVKEKLHSKMVSSFDNLVQVVKALNPNLQVRCEVDGRTLDWNTDQNEFVTERISLSAKSLISGGHIAAESIEENSRWKTSKNAEKLCMRPSLSESISLHSSGLTSGESLSSIASIIHKRQSNHFLGGIEEESSAVEADDVSEELSYAELKHVSDKNETSKPREPMVDIDRIHDLGYVVHLYAQLTRLRGANRIATTRLEQLLTKREDFLAQRNYLQQLDALISHYLQPLDESGSVINLFNRAVAQLTIYSSYLEQATNLDCYQTLPSEEIRIAKLYVGEFDCIDALAAAPDMSGSGSTAILGYRNSVGSPSRDYAAVYLSVMSNLELLFNIRVELSETIERFRSLLRQKEKVLSTILAIKV